MDHPTPPPPHDSSPAGDPAPRPDAPLTDQLLLTIMQEISRDAVLSLDPQGRITSWNQGAEELLGYPAAEVLGRHFDFMIPDDLKERGEVTRLIEETERKGFLRDYETRRITGQGKEVHVLLTRMRLLDSDGKLLGATAILRDITARKRMEDELVRARTLAGIGEFAARIAHEVKNPLTGISTALSVLRDTLETGHPHGELHDEIQRQIFRLDRIIDDLLTFARHRPVDRQQTDLVNLLTRVLSLVQDSGNLGNVKVIQYLDDEATVYVDPSMMEDVFFNLITNAADALRQEEQGELILAVKPGPRGVAVTITDNGPGIEDEVKDKIFDPFFTTKTRGTGLGLPISRKHIEAHGGWLRVLSAPHKRTTFEIFLPLDAIAASMTDNPVT